MPNGGLPAPRGCFAQPRLLTALWLRGAKPRFAYAFVVCYGTYAFTPPAGNVMWSCCSSPQQTTVSSSILMPQ